MKFGEKNKLEATESWNCCYEIWVSAI